MRKLLGLLAIVLSSPAMAGELDSAWGDGTVDATAAFDSAVQDTCSSDTRTLKIPVGVFRFLSSPAPIPCALNIVGEGPAVTQLVRDGPGVEFLTFIGGQDEYGGGSLRDLKIGTAPGWNGGIALTVRALLETNPDISSRNPHGLVIDNVLIGRQGAHDGTWNYGVYLDGSPNATPPPGVAEGIRMIRLRDVSVATAQIHSYLFWHASSVRASGIDCFITPNPTVYIWNSPGVVINAPTCEVIQK